MKLYHTDAPQPEGEPVTLTYTNWRGETARRTLTPKRIWWGATDWHPEPQWLLTAFDAEKQADRDFALKDFGAADGIDRIRAEIERLTKERDEARAQVAAAYEAAAIRSENYACGAPYNQRASINALANSLRGMTPDDAQAALEAHGREKVREGMQRAADIAYAGKNSTATSYHRGQIKRAILADM